MNTAFQSDKKNQLMAKVLQAECLAVHDNSLQIHIIHIYVFM